MKRALMMLALAALLAAALIGPVPIHAATTCTCAQQMTACDNECASELCVARFICNTANPCDSSCSCIRCRP